MRNYSKIGAEVGVLVSKKQLAYGDAFSQAGQIIKILYPNGIPTEGYASALTIVRVLDKLFRIANAKGQPDSMGESPWQDIAGYALLELGKVQDAPSPVEEKKAEKNVEGVVDWSGVGEDFSFACVDGHTMTAFRLPSGKWLLEIWKPGKAVSILRLEVSSLEEAKKRVNEWIVEAKKTLEAEKGRVEPREEPKPDKMSPEEESLENAKDCPLEQPRSCRLTQDSKYNWWLQVWERGVMLFCRPVDSLEAGKAEAKQYDSPAVTRLAEQPAPSEKKAERLKEPKPGKVENHGVLNFENGTATIHHVPQVWWVEIAQDGQMPFTLQAKSAEDAREKAEEHFRELE